MIDKNKNPLEGIFAQVTDDDLLRENGLLYAENNQLQSNWNSLKEELYQANRVLVPNELVNGKELINNVLDKMNELEGRKDENN